MSFKIIIRISKFTDRAIGKGTYSRFGKITYQDLHFVSNK